MTTRNEKRLSIPTDSKKVSQCWRENSHDSDCASRSIAGMPGARGWTPVHFLSCHARRIYDRLSLRNDVGPSLFRRSRLGLSEANNVLKRSKSMKQRIRSQWQLGFLRTVAIVVLSAFAFQCSLAHAATDAAARVVKYSKEDIVPVRAKLRFSTLIVLPEDEEILDFTTGDKEFWVINGAHNLCYVHPAQTGIRSNLNLITASGHVYSFLLTEISNQPNAEPDLKIFVEPKETSGFAAKTGLAGYVSAGEAEAYKKELAALRTQSVEEIHAAEVRAADDV